MMKRILSLLLALALAAPAVPARAAEPASPAYDGYLISLAQPADEALVEATGCETVGDNLYYAETVRDAGAIAALGEVEYWTTNDILATQDSFAGYETPFWNLRSVDDLNGAGALMGRPDPARRPVFCHDTSPNKGTGQREGRSPFSALLFLPKGTL